MADLKNIQTERLLMRPWREEDLIPFVEMNADPRVMEYFPALLSKEESDASARRVMEHFEKYGYSMWAVEVLGSPGFIGFIGLYHPTFTAAFTPCVEIGWRLAAPYWGRGYATEGARMAMRLGFTELNLPEIVSLTTPTNRRSWQVMEKLGMHRDPAEDFEHPRVPVGNPLRLHVLYRLLREEWERQGTQPTPVR